MKIGRVKTGVACIIVDLQDIIRYTFSRYRMCNNVHLSKVIASYL